MSDRKLEIVTKAIHPRALDGLGCDACILLLGIACDLSGGKIEAFSMKSYFTACGSPCCIAGNLLDRLGFAAKECQDEIGDLLGSWLASDDALARLFSGKSPSNRQLAARAIERYVFEGADDPWGA